MKDENKELLKILSTFILLWSLNIIAVYLMQQFMLYAFDNCVTHICGCTHNYGIQDFLWMITPLFYFLVPFYYLMSFYPFEAKTE